MDTVFTIMSHGLRTVPPELSIDSLVDLFVEENLSRVLVVDHSGNPLGVVSKSDVILHQYLNAGGGESSEPRALLRKGITAPLGWGFHFTGDEETVGQVMNPEVVAVHEGASIAEACELMIRSRVHGMPVISPTRGPVGWLSQTDIIRSFVAGNQSLRTGGDGAGLKIASGPSAHLAPPPREK